MIFMDTNVFVFANIKDYPEHEACLKKLQEKMLTEELAINIFVLSESFHILSKHLDKTDAEYRVESLLSSRRIRYVDVSLSTFKEAMSISKEKDIRINDAVVYASMKENGITQILTTNEKDFRKIRGVIVENPLRA